MTSTGFRFRLVCRGVNAEGVRVRRVRTIEAPTYEDAWAIYGSDHAEDMAHELRDLSFSVLPPCGWRMDGTVSKGFEAA